MDTPREATAKKLIEWKEDNRYSDAKMAELLGITEPKRYKDVMLGKESLTLDEWFHLSCNVHHSSLVFLQDYIYEISKRRDNK